jgi:hypothetical protein
MHTLVRTEYDDDADAPTVDAAAVPVQPAKPTKPTPALPDAVRAEAAGVLGLCLSLFESAVAALAAGEDENDDADDAMELDAAKSASRPPKAPSLSPAAACGAMRSLGRLAGVLLDFLEDAASPGAAVPWDDPLTLAVLRALFCFLAEAPGAHADRWPRLLPHALARTRDAAAPGGALCFLLPALLQATDVDTAAAAMADGDDDAAPGGGVSAAAAVTDALVEARGAEALAALVGAAASGAGGAADAAATSAEAREALIGSALGVMRNIAARGMRAPVRACVDARAVS